MANKICLRCGYCCQTSLVTIVVDSEREPGPDNVRVINCLEERCPHLEGSVAGKFECKIHNKGWFSGTPCGQYNTYVSGQKDVPCLMGEYIIGVANND
jgi:hypothetical protein